jgi:hypothetical protein
MRKRGSVSLRASARYKEAENNGINRFCATIRVRPNRQCNPSRDVELQPRRLKGLPPTRDEGLQQGFVTGRILPPC